MRTQSKYALRIFVTLVLATLLPLQAFARAQKGEAAELAAVEAIRLCSENAPAILKLVGLDETAGSFEAMRRIGNSEEARRLRDADADRQVKAWQWKADEFKSRVEARSSETRSIAKQIQALYNGIAESVYEFGKLTENRHPNMVGVIDFSPRDALNPIPLSDKFSLQELRDGVSAMEFLATVIEKVNRRLEALHAETSNDDVVKLGLGPNTQPRSVQDLIPWSYQKITLKSLWEVGS